MRVQWKKMIVAAAAGFLLTGTGFAASPADTYQEAVNTMLAHPEGQYTVSLALKTPMMQADLVNVIGVKSKPFQVKSDSSLQLLHQSGGTATIYVEQKGKQLDIYRGIERNGQTEWTKDVRALKDDMPLAAHFTGGHKVLAGVRDVQNNGGNRYTVTYDAKRLYTAGDEAVWIADGADKEQAATAAAALQALQKQGDPVFVVTIDPRTKRITRVEGALSGAVQSVAKVIIDHVNASASTKKFVQTMLERSTLDVSVDCAKLPDGADLTVPQHVKNASEQNQTQRKTA